MSYCTVEDIKKITKIKAEKLGYKENHAEFDELIQDWISQSESLINSYCHKEWENEVPAAVKNVCIRLTANIIAFSHARKDNPVKQVNDYNLKIFSSEVFTDDLRQDLKPFKKAKKISVFNI